MRMFKVIGIVRAAGLATLTALLFAQIGGVEIGHADGNSALAQRMKRMSAAVKNLQHPGVPPAAANPMDDFKQLKDAAQDCRDHSDDFAPAEVAKDPQLLKAFKAEFELLVSKVDVLAGALQLPADAENREALVKAALADVLAVKKDGHSKFNP